MRNTGLEEAQAGIKIAGRNIYNLRYADATTLMAKSEEELKRLLMKVKEESEKVGLKLNIQKTNIMASSPITSWQIDGETGETVADFIFWGSKISADVDCSHEIKRLFLLGRKAMSNLDSVLKSRNITLSTKVHLVKAMVFPVVLYGCESWTVKKAECQRIDAFELWCWRGLLRVPWIARRSNLIPKGNQPWVFTGKTDAEAEAPVPQSPDVKSQVIGKDPDAGKIDGRRRGRQRMRWLDDITDSKDISLSKLWEIVGDWKPGCCGPWGHKESDKTERLSTAQHMIVMTIRIE